MFYREIHKDAQKRIAEELIEKGHEAKIEYRKQGVIFDVYDLTTDEGYEVLTAKFQRSAHEQDEVVIAKMLRYLLRCKQLHFIVACVDNEDLDYLHNMQIEHWHYSYSWLGGFRQRYRHSGKSAKTIAKRITAAMKRIAPLGEWCKEGRRDHKKIPQFEKLTKKLGLPKNFLIGIWRDWHLNWVWKLERELQRWNKKK
jgi:hypothetical protein